MKKTTTLIIILLSAAFISFSCRGMIGKVPTSLVKVTVGSNHTAVLDIRPATFLERAKQFLAQNLSLPVASAAIPSIVQDLRLTVSATDMTTISATVNVVGLASADFIVDVPNGLQRHFVVEGLDSAAAVQYNGEAYSDLIGDPILLTINMVAVSSIPLAVLSTQPTANAINVPIDTTVSVLFNKAIDATTITPSTFMLKDSNGVSVAGSLLASGSTATFTPAATLTYSAQYTATITSGVKDLAGNALAADQIWSFTVAADAIPPTFAGLTLATNLTITSMQLSWAPATDNVTSSANMVYVIYQANITGGEAFATPSYTTPAGATSYIVTGLIPGNSYYFVVRAKDEAGNLDANVVERSATYPGRYVANAGSDANLCTQSAQCQTIGRALALTTINDGIFVSAGTYTQSIGFTLTNANALACTGPNHTTIITSTLTGGTMITGSQGVIIDGCQIIMASSGASPMIADSGTDITVNNCILKGITNASPMGIALSGNSLVQNTTLSNFIMNGLSGDAISVTGGSSLISDNTFTANYNGVNLTIGAGTPTPTITGNTFAGHTNGILVSAGTATISVNTISNNSTGVNISGGSPAVNSNTINNNSGTGISIGAGAVTPSVSGNIVNNNSIGISIAGSTPLPVINNNSIYCNSSSDLVVSGTVSAIDVRSNSWDHDSTTIPTGPTTFSGTCPAGTDICNQGGTLPTYSPFNTAVPSGCL